MDDVRATKPRAAAGMTNYAEGLALDLCIAWLRSTQQQGRCRPDALQVGIDTLQAAKARLCQPIRLAPVKPGIWAVQRAGEPALVYDCAGSRSRQREAAMRLLGLLLAQGAPLVYAEASGAVPDALFPEDGKHRGVSTLRNARNATAASLERAGFSDVATELRRISLATDGGIQFKPSGRIVVLATG